MELLQICTLNENVLDVHDRLMFIVIKLFAGAISSLNLRNIVLLVLLLRLFEIRFLRSEIEKAFS